MSATNHEAPYVLEAAKSLNVHLGWVVQTYNASEALANLVHPFWMLPLLGMDHKRLTVRFSCRDMRLTDVHGDIIRDILA